MSGPHPRFPESKPVVCSGGLGEVVSPPWEPTSSQLTSESDTGGESSMSGRGSCLTATFLLSFRSLARASATCRGEEANVRLFRRGTAVRRSHHTRSALTTFAGFSFHVESSLDTSSSGFILTSFAKEISSRRTRWKRP